MKRSIHPIAATTALLLVSCFWTATVISELLLSHGAVTAVKRAIVYGMGMLIPAIIATAVSGFLLAKSRRGIGAESKKKRMPFIALNGLFVLAPAAFFLDGKAAVGEFDAAFYAVQVIELAAGALQLTLLSMNFRDGLRLRGHLRPPPERAVARIHAR